MNSTLFPVIITNDKNKKTNIYREFMSQQSHVLHSFSLPFAGVKKLYSEISSLFHQTQVPTLQISRIKTLHLYWNMGKLIIEVECDENISGEDHHKLLSQLSGRLTKEFGEPFNFSALEDSCKFYLIYSLFPKKNTLSGRAKTTEFQNPLPWDHYRLLIHVSCPKARIFYEKEASNSNRSLPLLKHFIKCRLFERLSNSPNKENVLRSAQQESLELFSSHNNYLDKPMDKQKITRRVYERS
ncbi:MAG: hypothetical protein KA112_04940 [Alphaproteobacteria bacterium]|nr:hypothetical protein [Alphaproteobacteria bacterium]